MDRKDRLEKKVSDLEFKVVHLENRLKIEYLKVKLLADILQTNFNIKLSSLDEEDSILTICSLLPSIKINYNIEGDNLVIKESESTQEIKEIKESIQEIKEETVNIKEKREHFKTLKNAPVITKEEKEESVIDFKENRMKCERSIEEAFIKLEDVKDIKEINKVVNTIKENRINLLICVEAEYYIKVVNVHLSRLEIAFKAKFKNSTKKIEDLLKNCLSSLESRLVFQQEYHLRNLDYEDLKKFISNYSLKLNNQFTPFDKSIFFKKFCNYSLALISVEELIKKYFTGTSIFSNLIYLPSEKSDIKDPHSFYFLEREEKGKKFWKMDCRLEEISFEFADEILIYLVSLFRRIYYDIFQDNEYRPDFLTHSMVTKTECKQIILNIIFLCNKFQFCKFLQNIIIEKCSYSSSVDKFNLFADDKMQKRTFVTHREKSKENFNLQAEDSLGSLFDNSNDNEVIKKLLVIN
jgi:hypothetical protein